MTRITFPLGHVALWNAILVNSRSWLAIEIVETEDAADPPADITAFKPGQPGPDVLLLRAPIARRTRLAVDLAGSHGSAGIAATAETDFDILVKGTSIATMRFAAAAGTATFIAAAETVLEPGRCAEHGGTGDSLCGPRRYRPCNRAEPGSVSRALQTDV